MTFMGSGILLMLSAKDQVVTAVAIIQGTIDPADGSGGSPCFFRDIQIGSVFAQHGGNLKALGEREQLIDCTEIFKKAVTFFL